MANVTIKNEINFTAIDKLNMISVPRDIKKLDKAITITGAIIYDTVDVNTGEVKGVGAVKTTDGDIYGFTSTTLIECTDMIIDVFTDGASEITIIPITGQSNAGRTFYQFKVLNVK